MIASANRELSIIEQPGALQANLRTNLALRKGKLEWYRGLNHLRYIPRVFLGFLALFLALTPGSASQAKESPSPP
jgi:hypothetical protein